MQFPEEREAGQKNKKQNKNTADSRNRDPTFSGFCTDVKFRLWVSGDENGLNPVMVSQALWTSLFGPAWLASPGLHVYLSGKRLPRSFR